ncbi:MAG: hypothetical protein HKM03_05340 [Steroidobacteraceae bacterium]|nr:hypothetical protein [Steroidobacteraceae bacterium]
MQDVIVDSWSRDAAITVETARSLRELNLGFLRLEGFAAPRLAALPDAHKAEIARCPYALFDLRFNDELYWLPRLRGPVSGRVAETLPADAAEVVAFVRLVLFYAWHLASTTPLSARLLLGMQSSTAAAFGQATVGRLTALAASEAANLSPRWRHCDAFWSGLVGAAERSDRAGLRRNQLRGLQVAVAARLPACAGGRQLSLGLVPMR